MSTAGFCRMEGFAVHGEVKAALDALKVPYTLAPKKSHLFLHVPGHPPICLAGRSKATKSWVTRNCVSKIQRLDL